MNGKSITDTLDTWFIKYVTEPWTEHVVNPKRNLGRNFRNIGKKPKDEEVTEYDIKISKGLYYLQKTFVSPQSLRRLGSIDLEACIDSVEGGYGFDNIKLTEDVRIVASGLSDEYVEKRRGDISKIVKAIERTFAKAESAADSLMREYLDIRGDPDTKTVRINWDKLEREKTEKIESAYIKLEPVEKRSKEIRAVKEELNQDVGVAMALYFGDCLMKMLPSIGNKVTKDMYYKGLEFITRIDFAGKGGIEIPTPRFSVLYERSKVYSK